MTNIEKRVWTVLFWMLAVMAILGLVTISHNLAEIRDAVQKPPVVVTVVCPAGTAQILAGAGEVWTCVSDREAG